MENQTIYFNIHGGLLTHAIGKNMIGYDPYWYANQLALGLLMPQSKKPLKQPKKAVEVTQELMNKKSQ